MTHNAHNDNINVTTTKEKRLMFIMPRKHSISNYLHWKDNNTEHNPFHPNLFHQPSYNLWLYEEYILTTLIFPLVYLNEPYCDYSIFHTPGKKDHLIQV